MPVISTANPKGGCGKSTIALVTALTFAARGAKVTIIDADIALTLVSWHSAGTRPVSVVGNVNDDNIAQMIATERRRNDLVIVDNEGVAGVMTKRAVALSDLVLVPLQPSALDAAQAGRAIMMVRAVEKKEGRSIATRAVLTRTNEAVPTRRTRQIMSEIHRLGIPVLATQLHQRVAFEALFYEKKTLSELVGRKDAGNVDAAIANAEQLADEMMAVIRSIGEGRAA
jgi:chromosome partitioning protein